MRKPAAFKVSKAERDAIKEFIAGLAFICQISDTGKLVDRAFNELERRRNAAPPMGGGKGGKQE